MRSNGERDATNTQNTERVREKRGDTVNGLVCSLCGGVLTVFAERNPRPVPCVSCVGTSQTKNVHAHLYARRVDHGQPLTRNDYKILNTHSTSTRKTTQRGTRICCVLLLCCGGGVVVLFSADTDRPFGYNRLQILALENKGVFFVFHVHVCRVVGNSQDPVPGMALNAIFRDSRSRGNDFCNSRDFFVLRIKTQKSTRKLKVLIAIYLQPCISFFLLLSYG